MKSLVLVMLLAAAATAAVLDNELSDVVEVPDGANMVDEVLNEADEQELTGVTSRRNLSIGTISGSTILNRVVRANGVANRILVINIPANAGSRRITAVRVTQIGASQNARPSIVNGGVGNNHITIRITSARGRGYHYRVQVYARFP